VLRCGYFISHANGHFERREKLPWSHSLRFVCQMNF
jgi:hypothetical protein